MYITIPHPNDVISLSSDINMTLKRLCLDFLVLHQASVMYIQSPLGHYCPGANIIPCTWRFYQERPVIAIQWLHVFSATQHALPLVCLCTDWTSSSGGSVTDPSQWQCPQRGGHLPSRGLNTAEHALFISVKSRYQYISIDTNILKRNMNTELFTSKVSHFKVSSSELQRFFEII